MTRWRPFVWTLWIGGCGGDPVGPAEVAPATQSLRTWDVSGSAAWTIEGNQEFSYLGTAFAAGDVTGDGWVDVVVGSDHYEIGGVHGGAVFGFAGSPTGLPTIPDWVLFPDEADAQFGEAVATPDVNGDGFADLLVGASEYADRGMAALYVGSASGPSGGAPDWSVVSDEIDSRLGMDATTAGDVNGDGYEDVVLGAYQAVTVTTIGRAYLYLGSATGPSTTADWTYDATVVEDELGFAIDAASAGDVDDDGFGDVLFRSAVSRAFLFRGSSSGLENVASWSYLDEATSFASAGDVNADGYGDVILGQGFDEFFDDGDDGRVFLFLGSETGLATTAAWTGPTDMPGIGFSVSSAGDIDADGFDDVVVGARGLSEGADGALVFRGATSGLSVEPVCEIQDVLGFQNAVAPAGDVDHDGFADILVGDPFREPPENAGAAMLFLGPTCTDTDGDGVPNETDVCVGGDLDVTGYTVVDLGDGDGVVERGEELEIVWSVDNLGSVDATNVVSVTSTTDLELTILAGQGAPLGGPDIAAGASDTIVGTTFEVLDDCTIDHDALLTVVLTTDAASSTCTFELPVVCDLPLVLTTGPWVVGQRTHSEVTGALPFEDVSFVVSTGGLGTGPCPPPLGGVCLDVLQPYPKTQRITADAAGVARWSFQLPAATPVGTDMWIQAVNARGKSNVEARTTRP